MDNFDTQNSLNYQTTPPTTVIMAGGSNKDCSPMRTDDITFNFNANLQEVREEASGDNPDISKSNYPPTNSYLQSAEGLEALPHNDGASSESDPNLIQQKKSGSNVIVDESPLQLQMEKNKECKLNLKHLKYSVFLAKLDVLPFFRNHN